MNSKTISIVRSGLISGLVYALLMAGFYHYDKEDFNVWKFLFNMTFFGIIMGWTTWYNLKAQEKHRNNSSNKES